VKKHTTTVRLIAIAFSVLIVSIGTVTFCIEKKSVKSNSDSSRAVPNSGIEVERLCEIDDMQNNTQSGCESDSKAEVSKVIQPLNSESDGFSVFGKEDVDSQVSVNPTNPAGLSEAVNPENAANSNELVNPDNAEKTVNPV